MTALNLTTGEGVRARIVLDRIAKAAGLASGQALLCHLESVDDDSIGLLAEAVHATMPDLAPVDELAVKVA
jgi:hypothetical protein